MNLNSDNNHKVTIEALSKESTFLLSKVKNNLWAFCVSSCLFGITDRSIASLADGYLSPLEICQLFTTSLLLLSWLWLKPEISLNSGGINIIQRYFDNFNDVDEHKGYLTKASERMFELQKYHKISQEYILPFPYFCQIYHLLNLKHLETIHHFSLSNLKVVKVSDFQVTENGGIIKFQTVLDSPINTLRIFRPPLVEVKLVLHNPYTVELNIPVYQDKKIVVMFNTVPLNQNEHKFFIDIYSNLEYPNFLLQTLLHFAACLTLFEDLPYLSKLAKTNINRLANSNRASEPETMMLFRRFIELYGVKIVRTHLGSNNTIIAKA